MVNSITRCCKFNFAPMFVNRGQSNWANAKEFPLIPILRAGPMGVTGPRAE